MGPFYVVLRGPNTTYFLQKPNVRRRTSQNCTHTPVNAEDLALFSEFDGEYYFDGNIESTGFQEEDHVGLNGAVIRKSDSLFLCA